MHWILQEFDDTRALANVLERMGIPFSWHRIIPFLGELVPEPVVTDRNDVIIFGSYSVWRHAEARGYRPGVFRIPSFIEEAAWHPYLLNGPDAVILSLDEVQDRVEDDGSLWFLRPVDDTKELAGRVRSTTEIIEIARSALTLDPAETPHGSLRHDTRLMLCRPVNIQKEWRTWVVDGRVVTHSLYKEGSRVVYRQEIDDDALAFAQAMADLNPGHGRAFALDICRTSHGLRLLETNCVNSAGLYAADLFRLVEAMEDLGP